MDKQVEITGRASKAVTTSIAREGEARIPVPVGSDVKVLVPRDAVTSMARDGDDLILKFADGSSIRLEGYFGCTTGDADQLFLDDPASGAEWLVHLDKTTCFAPDDATSEALRYDLTPLESAAAGAGGLGNGLLIGLGAVALGGGIALASSSGGGGRDDPPAPPVDTTPPAAPVVAPSNGRTLSGTAEAGATVRLDLNGDGTTDATVTAGTNGAWTYTPAPPIANGVAVSVTAVDAAGNVSPTTRITVDAAPPAAPTIAPSDGTVLTGTAEAGSTVRIDLNGDGTPEATVTANGAGVWTYTPPTPLPDGTTVTVTATDAVGNVSAPTSITLDLAAPAPPVVGTVLDDVGTIQGALVNGAASDDRQPTLSGTAEAGATIAVFDGPTLIGTTTAGATGAWSFTPATPLGEGAHSLTITATDAAGHTSAPSTPFAFTIDTTAPGAPLLDPSDGLTVSGSAEVGAIIAVDLDGDGVADVTTTTDGEGLWSVVLTTPLADGTVVSATATDAAGNVSPAGTVTVAIPAPPAAPVFDGASDDTGTVQGALVENEATDDATPTFAGEAEAGSTISIYDGGVLIGTAIADPAGTWSFTPDEPLTEGSHSLTFTATDTEGLESAPSAPFAFVVDTIAPAAPTVAPSGGLGLTGTAEAGSTISIDLGDDGTIDGTALADDAGIWIFVPDTPLPDGTTVSVVATDPAGNASPSTTIVIDTSVPVAPEIADVLDDVEALIGSVPSGGLSNDATLTIIGTAPAGSTVIVYDGTDPIGVTLADATGAWSFTTEPLVEGDHTFWTTATDAGGTVTGPSIGYLVTVDLTAPAAPVFGPTDGTTLSGTAEPGAVILVDTDGDGDADANALAAPNGEWSVTFAPPLADGTVVSVVALDAAGNRSAATTGTVDSEIDTTPPPVPVLSSVTDNAAPVTGPVADGGSLNATAPILAGTAQPGVLVSVYDGGLLLGTTLTDGTGTWSFTPTTPLVDGPHAFTATTTDAVGNESQPSPAFTVVVDTIAPPAPVIAPSNGTLVSGTAEADAVVHLDLDGNGTFETTVQADASGAWSIAPVPPIANGLTIAATVSDAAGNTSTSAMATIDALAPPVPGVPTVTDDVGPLQGTLANGATTDDAQPTLSGSSEAGAVISIYDGATLLGTALADGAGAWSFTPSGPLTPGGHSLTVTATDARGNTSAPSAPFALTVDSAAPGTPAITTIADNAGPSQGVTANGGVTDDPRPALSGTAEAGATVSIYDNGALLGTVPTNGVGFWSFTPAAPLGEGSHVFVVTATDAAGNVSGQSNAYGLTIDTTPPAAPAITGAVDDVGPVQGALASGAATDDTRPLLSGTAEAGAVVAILQNGVQVATVTASPLGAWSYLPPAPLAPGSYSFTATATNAAGGVSPASAPFVLTIDPAAPAAPAITSATDDSGLYQGNLASGATTDDIMPVLSGTTEPNATVTVSDNGSLIGTATANGAGAWSFTPTSPLADGPHAFTATATDAVGNTGPASPAFTLVVDTIAPPAPLIDPSDGVVLTGTAEAGAIVDLDLDGDGTFDASTTADGDGDWSYTPGTPLPNGASVVATATDAAGNTSGTDTIVVDRTAPAAPIITALVDDQGARTGTVPSGGASDDTLPLLTGTAEPGATVTVFDNGSPIGTATASGTGGWSLQLTAALTNGPHAFTATALDALGNPSAPSAAYTVAIDTTTPAAPVITTVTDDVGTTQGPVANGAGTDDALPAIGGTSAANAVISVYDGVTLLGTTTANGAGAWSFTPTPPLDDGPHSFAATATNAAGTVGPVSNAYAIDVDTVVPEAPVILLADDDQPGIEGPVGDGGLTNDLTPDLLGLAEPNAVVSIFANGVLLGTAIADPAGVWSFAATLSEGVQAITAVSVNEAGNASPVSDTFTLTIDATAPDAPLVDATNGSGDLTGTAEPFATVSIDLGDGGPAETVVADAGGVWSYTFASTPADGTTITVTATDEAGNTSPTTSVVVDQTAPGAPSLTAVTDDQGAVTGPVGNGGATDDTQPVLTGIAEAGTLVTIFDNGIEIGTALAGPGGAWSFTPTLAAGPHSITLTATDAAGNPSPASGAFAFTVVTGTPAAPVITAVNDDAPALTGVVASGSASNDTTPTVSGTAAPGAVITLFIDGVAQPGTTVANGSGDWSFTPTLTAGPHSFTATATNAAGNVSPASNAYAVTIDTTAPDAPVVDPSDGTTVSGTGEPGAVIDLFVGGSPTAAASTTVDSFGNWSVTFAPPLADETEVTALATDAAGNVSLPGSTTVDETIDSTPPSVPAITAIADDIAPVVGPVSLGGTTNDVAPLITGTTDPGALVTVYDGASPIGTVIADGGGNWSFTPGTPLVDGAHSLSATATEGGLESQNSAPIAFTVDTVAPPLPTIAPSNGTTLTGTAEANASVLLDLDNDGTSDVIVAASGTGAWAYTPPTPPADATVVTAQARDAAGNLSPIATATIDRAAPATPTITSANDDAAPVIGPVANGGATNDTTPTLGGAAEAGATVSVFDGATLLGTTVATGGGTWSFTSSALVPGSHSFTVTATDALGNVSGASGAYALTVITAAPAAPVIATATDDIGTLQGPIANGGATNDAQPALTGTGPANVAIAVFDGATLVGTTTSDGTGNWALTPTTLGTGTHALTAIATNAAGLQSPASASYTVTVDTTAPATPVLTSVTDDVGSSQGALTNGASTDDTRPTLAGTAEANATVSIFDGATLLGTTTANGAGAWSFTPPTALATGGHSLTVTATDAVGNTSGATAAFTLTVDTTPPAAPTITGASDDVGVIQGPVANGGVTDDAAPLLSGTAEANATVLVYDNGALLGTTTANGAGAWSFTPPTPLADGTHSFTATARDAAGNVGPASAAYLVVVDTAPPVAPTISSAFDDIGPQTGTMSTGASTNDTQPTLSGLSEANAPLAIFDNGVQIGTTTANALGVWSFTPTTPLPDGNHLFTARATDASGNQSPVSSPFALRVDTAAPAAPVIASLTDDVGTVQGVIASGGVTNDTLPLLRGTGEAGSALTILANGVAIGTTLVDGAGNWTFLPTTPLPEGLASFTATTTDAAGNVSPVSNLYAVTIDTSAPATPVITSVVDDFPPNTGAVANGGLSNDATPQLLGTAAPSTTVLIYDGGTLIGSTTSNALGAWSFTPSSAIANGAHSFTAVAVDPAGNPSPSSNTYTMSVDSVAPTQTIAITTLTTDTGTLGDWSTQDTSPTIGGTLSTGLGTGEQVQVQVDGGAWVNATSSGSTWFYGTGTLTVGSHTVSARVVDAAGNIGSSATQGLAITAIPAQAPVVQATSGSLLGLVGLETLNLINLSGQALTAVDPNNNLRSVQVRYAPLLSLSLGTYTLTASTALATELGLVVAVTNTSGIAGIIAPTSTLTITAIGGGAMDNLAVNELLNTVHFQQSLPLLSLDVLNATSITATDTTNLTATASTGTLLDASLLNASGSPNLIEGGTGNDVLTGTTGNDRLYGHAGTDTLSGGNGDDFLRGGAGADTLRGEAGNDTLVYDAADTLIDGGTGSDTLFVDTGTGPVLNLGTATAIANIEVINLGTGDAGRQITLTEAGVLRATDAAHQLTINGDGNDTVTMTGAVFQGQALIGGEAYKHYTLGTADIYLDHPVIAVV
jgi:hypothetical protein